MTDRDKPDRGASRGPHREDEHTGDDAERESRDTGGDAAEAGSVAEREGGEW